MSHKKRHFKQNFNVALAGLTGRNIVFFFIHDNVHSDNVVIVFVPSYSVMNEPGVIIAVTRSRMMLYLMGAYG